MQWSIIIACLASNRVTGAILTAPGPLEEANAELSVRSGTAPHSLHRLTTRIKNGTACIPISSGLYTD